MTTSATPATPVHLDLPATVGTPGWTDNWTVGREVLHGEVCDTGTGLVWLAQAPMTRSQFDALELPEGFVKTGIGESVADLAFFSRSPGASADGPVETCEIGGFRFSLVARPGIPEMPGRGVFVLDVEKHHRVLYRAGTTIEVMDFGDGADYVQLTRNAVMAGRRADAPRRERVLPEGWSVRTVTLAEDLVVDLPCPTRVCFFACGDSFQGPLRLGI